MASVYDPYDEEPLFLVGDLSEEEMDAITSEPSKERARERLAAVVNIDQDDDKTAICKDMHFYNFLFCHSACFSAQKTSCFLAIMKRVFRSMIAERLTCVESFELCKALLLKHSVSRPPWSIAIFSCNDLKVITDYVLNTFFRHYNLYQYVYVPHRDLTLRTRPNTFLGPTPGAHPFEDMHIVDAKAQEELAMEFENPQRVEDLAAELFGELADRETRISGEAQRVIAMALERRSAKVLADFEDRILQQDKEFEKLIQEGTV